MSDGMIITYEEYGDLREEFVGMDVTTCGIIKSLSISPINDTLCSVDIEYFQDTMDEYSPSEIIG